MQAVTDSVKSEGASRRVKVSVIIPVYNEFRSLPQVLQRVLDAPLPEGCEKEIILVDDGSTDGTADLVESYRGSPLVLVHHSVVNFGKGAAIRVGLAKATGDIVLIQDGDLEYDPQDYPKVLEPIVSGHATVVYGSRFAGRLQGMKWANWLANKILTLASNLLFGARITDEATAYKAFRTDVLRSLRLTCLRFEFCPEVTAKVRRLGHRIHEVPISYNARGILEGKKIRWQDGFQALWTLIRYRLAPKAEVSPTAARVQSHDWTPILRWAVWLSLPVLLYVYFGSAAGKILPLSDLGRAFEQIVALVSTPLVDVPLLVRWALQSYSLGLLIILSDLVFGLAILRRLPVRSIPTPLAAAVALALGSGLATAGMFGLGLARQLNVRSVFALTLIMAAVGLVGLDWRSSRRWITSLVRSFSVSRGNRGLALVIAVVALPVIAVHAADLMMPVLEFDSAMYHMSAAKLYREAASLPYHDGIRFNAQPQLPVLLYLREWFLLGDEVLAKLANVEFGLILLLTLVAAARELSWRDSWVLGSLFVCAAPVMCWVAKIEYADFALTAYFALGSVLLYRQLRRRRFDLALPTGLALGFAGACKYQGLVLVAAAFAGYLLAAAVARVPVRQVLRVGAILALGVLLVGSMWWLRSWHYTGSPFYPFFAPADPSADAGRLFEVNTAFGPGRTPSAFLLIGYHVATMLPYAYGDPFGFGLPLLLVQAIGGMALLGMLWVRPRLSPGIVFLVAVCMTYLLFWFSTGPVLRYLASLLPLFAVLLLVSLRTLKTVGRLPVLLTCACALLTVHSALMSSTVRRYGVLPPVTFAQKDAVLVNVFPCYPAARALNQAQQPGELTYLLFAEDARFYLDGQAYGDWFGRYNYAWLARDAVSVQGMIAKWRQAGFRYVLVNHEQAAGRGSIFPAEFLNSAFARPSVDFPDGRRLSSDGRYSVFRLE